MFGCASLPIMDAAALRTQLAYLHHNHLAPERIRACALPERYTEMNLVPTEEIDARRVAAALPPLIKGIYDLAAMLVMERSLIINSTRPMSVSSSRL